MRESNSPPTNRAGGKERRERRCEKKELHVLHVEPLPGVTHFTHAEDVLLLPVGSKMRCSIPVKLNHRIVCERLDAQDSPARPHDPRELRKCASEIEVMQHSRAKTCAERARWKASILTVPLEKTRSVAYARNFSSLRCISHRHFAYVDAKCDLCAGFRCFDRQKTIATGIVEECARWN